MDNDHYIKKNFSKLYRSLRLKIDYAHMGLLSESEGNNLIIKYITQQNAFMLGRLGAVEMHCVSRWMAGQNYTDEERRQALYAAGIFPNDQKTLDKFCEIYTNSMKSIDLLGVWEVPGEKKVIRQYCPAAQILPSRSIEPYYFTHPWSERLNNKKVLIIHPFVDSIQIQLKKRELLWSNKKILPSFESTQYVKSIQSNGGGITKFKDWFEALELMKCQISACNFDIAIIGAGAYGLVLAAHVKSMRKQSIQMCGATQILFGIKGKRWDTHPVISKFYNDAWIRPLPSETPPEFQKVEGGSYW